MDAEGSPAVCFVAGSHPLRRRHSEELRGGELACLAPASRWIRAVPRSPARSWVVKIWEEKKSKVAVGVDFVDGEDGAGRRFFGAELCRLPDRAGEPPEVLPGKCVDAEGFNATSSWRVVSLEVQLEYSSCNLDDLTPDKVMGKVVVCTQMAGAETGFYVERAGGAGMVSPQSMERFWDAVMADTFTLPGVMISDTASKKLEDYMSSSPYPVASFTFACETVTGQNRAPIVAAFSSRGPSVLAPEILKPDVVAPGVNILGAWSGAAPPSESLIDPRRVEYNILSGTSMACPHVAGAAALIKKIHGDWTPAMVRSALMTTAGPLDKNGRDIVDSGTVAGAVMDATPLAAGAGIVLPRLAMDPGLVYDAGTQDYVDFLCTLNYTSDQFRQFVPEMSAGCGARMIPGGVANLNYPSFVVVFDRSNGGVRTLTRTVTKVSAKPETYNVTFAAPEDVQVTVTPTTLEFKGKNEKQSYTVEFTGLQSKGKGRHVGTWDFGYISWENRKHRVRSPVAFNWKI